jgi:hypothetical protein
LDREITAAISGHCPQEAVQQQLEDAAEGGLEERREELAGRLAAAEKELQSQFERRGQLAQQMKTLADDRHLATKYLELATLEKRLQDALQRWQVLAVTCRVLDDIRTTYEHDRQPETLREASGYLDRLTQGRYLRVWTPLGENVLRVDDAEGHSMPVESLSRGTREQLFLSLRLALAAFYARRGAPLPLVLDDVLVNFDSERAKAAAAVLRDFAAAGHQLLVFTCHEHIEQLFRSLKVPVSQLPDHAEAEHAPLVLEEPPKEKPKRAAKPASVPAPEPPPAPPSAPPPVPHKEKEGKKKKKKKHAKLKEVFYDEDADETFEEEDASEEKKDVRKSPRKEPQWDEEDEGSGEEAGQRQSFDEDAMWDEDDEESMWDEDDQEEGEEE